MGSLAIAAAILATAQLPQVDLAFAEEASILPTVDAPAAATV